MNVQELYQRVDGLLEKYGREEKSLIAVLQGIQEHDSYLPKEVFPYLAEKMGLSDATIYGVATFYENFSLEAKGKYVIKVCDGTACHVRKSIPILNRLREELGLQPGEKTTSDQMFTVETVSCLGACGLAPALTVNGQVHPAMTPDKTVELIEELRREA